MLVSPIIEFQNISFAYKDEENLYSNLSFGLEKGNFYLIKGPSGIGKSTLLRLINRMEEPTEGEILFNGQPVRSMVASKLRTSIIYIQQTPVVLDGTIKENLLLPFNYKANKELTKPDDKLLEKLLADYSIDNITLDRNAKNLSVGQMQRLCLIRGLLLSPDVILFDEPVSALDEKSSKIVEAHAEKLCLDEGKTIIMVSHKEFVPEQVKPLLIEVSALGVTLVDE